MTKWNLFQENKGSFILEDQVIHQLLIDLGRKIIMILSMYFKRHLKKLYICLNFYKTK